MNPTVTDLLTLTVFLYLAYSWSSFLFIAVMSSINCFHLRREIKELEKIQNQFTQEKKTMSLNDMEHNSMGVKPPSYYYDRVVRLVPGCVANGKHVNDPYIEETTKTALSDMPYWIKEQNRDRMNRVNGSEVD